MNTTPEVAVPGATAASSLPRLAPGAVLRGRFTIERFVGRGPLGEVYRAGDASDGKPVLVQLVQRELLRDGQTRIRLEQDIAIAAQLEHKNIAATYGFFGDGENLFIAAEPVDGSSLRQMLEKKLKTGRAFTLKGAYNVVTHICNALEYAHGAMLHGLLSADTVLVNPAGRVKLAYFGLSRSLPGQERFRASLLPAAIACMAPELPRAPDMADRRADVFSVGAMLFELLTGQAKHDRLVSELVAGVPPALDAVIEQCTSPSAPDRFNDMGELKRAIHAACGSALTAASAPPIPAGSAAPKPPPTPAGRPGAPQAAAARPGPPRIAQAKVPATFSIDSALSAVDEAHERWLIQKDKLDFGPFKLADVKEQIGKGQILGDHVIVDMENGERRKVREHALLKDLVLRAEGQQEATRQVEVAAAEARAHRRRVMTLIGLIGGLTIVVGGGVAAYVLTHQPKETTKIVYREKEGEDLLKGIEITMKVQPPPPKGSKRHGGGHGGSSKNAVGDFDSATNLGDANGEGGDETLGQDVVQHVMSQNFKSLTGCILEEKRRNSGLKTIDMDFVIRGSGSVSAVKVNGATNSPFASCMLDKMKSITFPKFNGAKTVAAFSLALK